MIQSSSNTSASMKTNNQLNAEPLISIVIPLYNGESSIAETMDSVLQQTCDDYEIIVVNDGSTDHGAEIIDQLRQSNDRIKIINTKNGGRPSIPRNIGINQSRGKYIAFIDQDDLWDENKLTYQLHVFEQYPEINFVSTLAKKFGDVSFSTDNYGIMPRKLSLDKQSLSKMNKIVCSSVMVKKSVFDVVGMFDEDPQLIAVEDYDLWIRILSSFEGCIIPLVLCYYRIHGSGASAVRSKMIERLEYLKHKRKYDIRIPESLNRTKGIHFYYIRNIIHLLLLVKYRYFYILKRVFHYRIGILTNTQKQIFI